MKPSSRPRSRSTTSEIRRSSSRAIRSRLAAPLTYGCRRTKGARYCREAPARRSADPEGGVPEEGVDGQQLGHGPGACVALLGGEDRVSQPRVPAGADLLEQHLLIEVGGAVDAEPGRGERGDGALALGLHELLAERVQWREVEEAAQAVHGREERLAALGGEARDVPDVEDVLG